MTLPGCHVAVVRATVTQYFLSLRLYFLRLLHTFHLVLLAFNGYSHERDRVQVSRPSHNWSHTTSTRRRSVARLRPHLRRRHYYSTSVQAMVLILFFSPLHVGTLTVPPSCDWALSDIFHFQRKTPKCAQTSMRHSGRECQRNTATGSLHDRQACIACVEAASYRAIDPNVNHSHITQQQRIACWRPSTRCASAWRRSLRR